MTIGEVHNRIAHIQSMMTAAAGAGRTTGATGVTATGTAATSGSTSATAFAAALQQASATADAHQHPKVAGGADTHKHEHEHVKPAAPAWTSPANGQVSSEFGRRWGAQHEGIDIAARSGSKVTAAAAGVVRKASWYGGYGNAVIIDHGKGVSTLYGHNSELNVKPGDKVRAGQKIAEIGSTGDSTGPHLHFEVEVNGKKINPRPWLEKRGIDL